MKTKVIKQKVSDIAFETTDIGADASNVDVVIVNPDTGEESVVDLQTLISQGSIGGQSEWIDI